MRRAAVSQFTALLLAVFSAPLSLSFPEPILAQQGAEPSPDSAIVLDPVVATATPVPVSASALGRHASLLDGEQLRAEGVVDVVDALRSVSGVTIVRTGSFGAVSSIFLRGGESDYVRVLLDGVALNQPGGAIDLSGLTMENVDRIEIVKGPASGLYGSDAVAGVIQIFTRGGEGELEGSASAYGGSYGRADGTLALRGGNESASFGVSVARYDTEGILDFNNRHLNTVFSARAEARIGNASTARVTARLQDRVYRFPTDGSGAVVDINQSSFSELATLGIELEQSLGDRFELRGLVSLHDADTGTDDPSDGPDDLVGFYGYHSLDAMRRVAGDVRVNWRRSDRTLLTLGTELEEQSVRSFNESLSEFGPSAGRSENSRSNAAGYAHALSSIGPVSVSGGARIERNEHFGGFLSYQAGLALPLRAGTRLTASVGRAIKEPTFFEIFASGFATGNPDLDPERSLSWEAGIEHALGGKLRVAAVWFDQSFEDLIQYTFSPPGPGDPNFFNVAAADARGLEVEAEAELGALDLTAGWTWLATEVVDSGFDEGPSATFVEGQALIRRPENHATLGARGRVGSRIRWNADFRLVGERSDRDFGVFPAEAVTLGSYTVLNLGLGATLLSAENGRPGLDLLVRAENVGDTEYEEAFGFRSPGRALYLGGRLSWEAR